MHVWNIESITVAYSRRASISLLTITVTFSVSVSVPTCSYSRLRMMRVGKRTRCYGRFFTTRVSTFKRSTVGCSWRASVGNQILQLLLRYTCLSLHNKYIHLFMPRVCKWTGNFNRIFCKSVCRWGSPQTCRKSWHRRVGRASARRLRDRHAFHTRL